MDKIYKGFYSRRKFEVLIHGLPFVLIMLLLLVKYFELFPVPSWLLVVALVLGAGVFFWEGIQERRRQKSQW